MSRPVEGRRILLARRPQGAPAATDFAIETVPLAPPASGEVVLATRWISVDPMIALLIGEAPLGGTIPAMPIGTPIAGAAVSEVLESNAPGLVAGDFVEGRSGWCDHVVVPAAALRKIDPALGASALGALGLPGFSAWIGLDLAGDVAGKTVLVSGAAGAVGMVAGQLAAERGAQVHGFAGSPERCRYLVERLGFAGAIDRRCDDVGAALAALGGIDLYFDNVGGPLIRDVLPHLARQATILVCGLMDDYVGGDAGPGESLPLRAFMAKSLRVIGFNNRDHLDRMPDFEREVAPILRNGSLIEVLNEKPGLEGVIAHMAEMFADDTIGKRVAVLAPDAPR